MRKLITIIFGRRAATAAYASNLAPLTYLPNGKLDHDAEYRNNLL